MTIKVISDDVFGPADRDALERLRNALAYYSPEQLMALCQGGDANALDVVANGLVAIRKQSGLSVAEFIGRDLCHELGLAAPVEH